MRSSSARIHRSGSASESASTASSGGSAPSRCIWTKRAAFQILVANARYPSIRLSSSGRSRPGEASAASVNRTASAPYSRTRSSGSITFPFVFDIFWPCASRTRPVRCTWANGALPVKWPHIMIMRATQKNRMSNPVISRLVG